MKSSIGRIAPEMKDLCMYRKNKFGTSFTQEQKNLVTIMNAVEKSLGIDIKNTIVTKDGATIQGRNKIWVIR